MKHTTTTAKSYHTPSHNTIFEASHNRDFVCVLRWVGIPTQKQQNKNILVCIEYREMVTL